MNPYGICAFLISLLLIIIYFQKKRFDSTENKIYDVIVISSFFSSIFSIFSYIITANYEQFPNYILIVPKIFLISLVVWGTSFSLYLIYISIKEKEFTIWKKIKTIMITISTIVAIFILYLPMEYYNENGSVFTSGSGVKLTYSLAFLYFVLVLIFIIKNIKLLFDKRYIPVFSFALLFVCAIMMQYFNPELLIITFVICFNTMIMYFTIENPDIRLLKEYEKAKDLLYNTIEEKELYALELSNQIKKNLSEMGEIISKNQDEKEVSELQNGYILINELKNDIVNKINNLNHVSKED